MKLKKIYGIGDRYQKLLAYRILKTQIKLDLKLLKKQYIKISNLYKNEPHGTERSIEYENLIFEINRKIEKKEKKLKKIKNIYKGKKNGKK